MNDARVRSALLRAGRAQYCFALLLLAACGQAPPPAAHAVLLPIDIRTQQLANPAVPCDNTFISHPLDHVTAMDDSSALGMFESNGAGLGINDLDNDGDLDLVLANLKGRNSILWNQGALSFRTEHLPHGDSRAVNLVDVDGDGWQDLVFSRRLDRPSYWRNEGSNAASRFTPVILPGVYYPAYAMTWGDVDADGDLDLAAAAYDAALEQAVIASHLTAFGGGVGVYYYEHQDDSFVPHKLAPTAQALAIALPDLDADGRLDLLVGNDFDLADAAWLREDGGWRAVKPFATTTRNTMSLDQGDVDNDGSLEILAVDMKPYDQGTRTIAAWRPMMEILPRPGPGARGQINENVLQVRDRRGRFHNQAYTRSVDATGWSWSAKFGDLDNDGFLDLYVVNGMIAEGLFDHLPGAELVEENQALRNDGRGAFVPVPAWGLGSTASGRGMSMADLDNDGDLDIVVNNLEQPARVFENRLCGGSSVLVDLLWPGSKNTRAIGARLALHTSAGSYYRDIRVASGYLSGDPARAHFGFPAGATLQRLDIYWPDGAASSVETPPARTLVTITR